MGANLRYNVGDTQFNTSLLTTGWDNINLTFGDIWITEEDVFKLEDFTLNVVVNNNNDSNQDVYLIIYSEDPGYYGQTSPITITANSGGTFSFTDDLGVSGYDIPIRIEAYIDVINYISIVIYIRVIGETRILTTTDIRDLTTGEIRVLV